VIGIDFASYLTAVRPLCVCPSERIAVDRKSKCDIDLAGLETLAVQQKIDAAKRLDSEVIQ
jgi:hypothetical protein